jgi:hypothetical protein
MSHKPKSDWDFLFERVTMQALSEFNGEAKGATLDLLRSDIPLSGDWRHYIAEQLELAWFKTPQERRVLRGKRLRKSADLKRKLLIDFIVHQDGISKDKAIEKIAERDGMTVDALLKARQPGRVSGASRRKK